MKKYIKLLSILWLCALSLSGGTKNDSDPLCRVVTGIEISCQHKDMPFHRYYTDSQKMEYVLIYLRLLKPLNKPVPYPETVSDDVYDIRLQLSDGSQKHYQQKDHRYFCLDNGLWQTIGPEQAEGLYRLMRRLPSDHI